MEQEFKRKSPTLTRQTMSNLLLRTTKDRLKLVYDVLHRQLSQEEVLHADGTTLQILKESEKSATSKSSCILLYRTNS